MITEKIPTNDSSLTGKELGDFIEQFDSLAEAAQKAADAVLSVNNAAIFPEGTIETLNLASEAYKLINDNAVSLGSISTDALGLVAGAAVAAATYVATFFDDLSVRLEQERDLVEESNRAIFDQTAAYENNVKVAEENIKKVDENADAAGRYWKKITELVDENGIAKESTDKLQAAVDQLNKVAGTNIEVIDGQIQGYGKLSNTMDTYVEKSRLAAKKSYLWDSYGEAVVNIDDLKEQLEEAKEEKKAAFKEYDEKLNLYNLANNYHYGDATFGPSVDLYELAIETDNAEKIYSDATTKVSALEQQIASYEETIKKYESLSEEENKLNKELDEIIKNATYEDDTEEITMDMTVNVKEVKAAPTVQENVLSRFSENVEDNESEAALDHIYENMVNSAYQSGENAAVRYMEGFEDELDRIYDSVMAERSLAVSGMTAGQQMASFNYYGSAPQINSTRDEKIVLENKADVTVKIDREVLGKTVMEWTKEYKRTTGT